MSELEKPENLNERLLSVLIGLARATEGNEEMITEETGWLLFQGLSLVVSDSAEDGTMETEACAYAHRMTELLGKIREEKKRLVPNCFDCASPCGRTADYDMQEFWDAKEEQVELKLALVRRLVKHGEDALRCQSVNTECAKNCLEALVVLGWNGSRESLLRVMEKVSIL